MRAQLFGVGAIDPLTLAIVVVLIGGTALLACWLPARGGAVERRGAVMILPFFLGRRWREAHEAADASH